MPNKTVTFGDVITYPSNPKKEVKKVEVDKPVKNPFNCGTLRNSLKLMAGGNGHHLIAIRLVRSKLRKREDNLHTTAPTVTTNHNNNVIQQQQPQQQPQQQLNNEVAISCPESTESLPPAFLWTNNSRCSTTASSQYTLYNNDEATDEIGTADVLVVMTPRVLQEVLTRSVLLQDTLVHGLACEEPRECKGFRKNLSGKWRRLVKKKPPQEVCTLPAEVREQLKTIYVY